MKDVKVDSFPSLGRFATKTVCGDVGKTARSLDPGSRQISVDSLTVFKTCSDYQTDKGLSASHQSKYCNIILVRCVQFAIDHIRTILWIKHQDSVISFLPAT